MKTRAEKKKAKVRPRNIRVTSEDSNVDIYANFRLAENVKYAAAGYMRQQCTRQIEDDEASRKTTCKI
jgi:hypothetical protein